MKYGKLTFLEDRGSRMAGREKKIFWLCRCDCGREKEFLKTNVLGGNSRSCGKCVKRGCKNWQKPHGVAASNHVFNSGKNGARRRGLEFAITLEQFLVLASRNCHYCGLPPQQEVSLYRKLPDGTRQMRVNGSFKYNGMDRVDNDRGYVIDNVVPSCMRCNMAKHKFAVQDFLAHIKRIYEHQHLETMNVEGDSTRPKLRETIWR